MPFCHSGKWVHEGKLRERFALECRLQASSKVSVKSRVWLTCLTLTEDPTAVVMTKASVGGVLAATDFPETMLAAAVLLEEGCGPEVELSTLLPAVEAALAAAVWEVVHTAYRAEKCIVCGNKSEFCAVRATP